MVDHGQPGIHALLTELGVVSILEADQLLLSDIDVMPLARAFKHAVSAAPDSVRDRIVLWHNARTSLTKVRVQLLGELDALVHDLPEDLRSQLRPAKTVSARVNSLRGLDTTAVTDPTVALRLRLIEHRVAMLRDVLEQDKAATTELTELVEETKSTLTCTAVGMLAIGVVGAPEQISRSRTCAVRRDRSSAMADTTRCRQLRAAPSEALAVRLPPRSRLLQPMSASRHTATGQSESAKSDVHDDVSMSDLETRPFELKKVLATAQRGTVASSMR